MMQPTPKESRIHTDELVDIREVSVDKNLPKEERIAAFIRQIKNPYRFRCGDFVVNACFAGNGVTLEECLQGICAERHPRFFRRECYDRCGKG